MASSGNFKFLCVYGKHITVEAAILLDVAVVKRQKVRWDCSVLKDIFPCVNFTGFRIVILRMVKAER